MIDNCYLFAKDSKRIFINTSLGLGLSSWVILNSSIKNVLLPRKRTLYFYKIKTYEL